MIIYVIIYIIIIIIIIFYLLFRKPVQGFHPMRYKNKRVARICESFFTR